MKKYQTLRFLILAVMALGWSGCVRSDGLDLPAQADDSIEIREAVAALQPTAGNQASGVVNFRKVGDGIEVSARVSGLTPGQEHAIHIHNVGDCSEEDAESAGGHYNPEDHPHALPSENQRHAGDLGNLPSSEDGTAEYKITVRNITLSGAGNPILGRSVIVHAKKDDGGQPSGNAGERIACGVIREAAE